MDGGGSRVCPDHYWNSLSWMAACAGIGAVCDSRRARELALPVGHSLVAPSHSGRNTSAPDTRISGTHHSRSFLSTYLSSGTPSLPGRLFSPVGGTGASP